MNSYITLTIYGFVSLALVTGGVFSLTKGFKLVLEGKGKTKEESSIEFAGIKITVGSIGGLVMITAFMWGWAAVQALPKLSQNPDGAIEIARLQSKLARTENQFKSLAETQARTAQIANELAGKAKDYEHKFEEASTQIASLKEDKKSLGSHISVLENQNQRYQELVNKFSMIIENSHFSEPSEAQLQEELRESILNFSPRQEY